MMTFLESNKFTAEAIERIVELIFGDLTIDEALKLDRDYSGLSDQEKMGIILKHLFQYHYKTKDREAFSNQNVLFLNENILF